LIVASFPRTGMTTLIDGQLALVRGAGRLGGLLVRPAAPASGR